MVDLQKFKPPHVATKVSEHFSFDDMMEAKLQVDASLAGTETARPLPAPNDASVLSQLVRPVEMASRDC